MIFQTEKQLKEYGKKLPADSKKSIEDALSELKKAHESKDLEGIDKAMAKMNTIWQSASQDMYKNASNEKGSGDTKKLCKISGNSTTDSTLTLIVLKSISP